VRKNLRLLLHILRTCERPLLPVRVRMAHARDVPGEWGHVYLYENEAGRPRDFVIKIRRNRMLRERKTLLHEWAHALTWQEGRAVRDHGTEFRSTLRRLERHYLRQDRAIEALEEHKRARKARKKAS